MADPFAAYQEHREDPFAAYAPASDHPAAPELGTRENPIDDLSYGAGATTRARVSLAPDPKVQIERYAEAFKQPVSDFLLVGDHIVRKIPSSGKFARVAPSVRGATGALDAAQRAFDWVAGGVGDTIPLAGSTIGAVGGTALGGLGGGMAGGAAGGAGGEFLREKLDAALAPEGKEAPIDTGEVLLQGGMGLAGPLIGKGLELASPIARRGLEDLGRVGAGEVASGIGVHSVGEGAAAAAPAAEALSPKALGLSEAGLAALRNQVTKNKLEQEQLEKDIAMLTGIGTPVDLSLGQKTGSTVLQQKERQLLRDPSTVQDVVDLRKMQNETQIPGAVRNVLDHIAPATGQEEAIGTFRAGADAVISENKRAQAEAASPIYNQAFKANPAMQSDKLDELLETDVGKDAFKYAIGRMRNRMRNAAGPPDPELTEQMNLLVARGEMKAVPGGVSPGLKLETLDLIKQGMWDAEEALRKRVLTGNAREGEVQEAADIRRAFTNELDNLDATAAGAPSKALPIADMKVAIRKAGKLPPKQVDQIIAHVDDMISEAGGATEVLDAYKFPKGQEDFYKAALSVVEDAADKAPGVGHNSGGGLYKRARQVFGDPAEDIDAMKKGGIGFVQRMTGQDRQAIVNRVFEGGNLLPEEISRMRQQFALAGKLEDWNVGVRSFVESKLADALKATQGGEVSNVGGKVYQSLFAPGTQQEKVMRAALGGDGNAAMKRWDALGRVMKAAAHQLAEGSASVTDLQAAPVLSRIATGLKLILHPKGVTSEALDKLGAPNTAEAAQQLAKAALTPEGDKILRQLYLQSPESPKAQSLLAQFFTQAGIVEAEDSATKSRSPAPGAYIWTPNGLVPKK